MPANPPNTYRVSRSALNSDILSRFLLAPIIFLFTFPLTLFIAMIIFPDYAETSMTVPFFFHMILVLLFLWGPYAKHTKEIRIDGDTLVLLKPFRQTVIPIGQLRKMEYVGRKRFISLSSEKQKVCILSKLENLPEFVSEMKFMNPSIEFDPRLLKIIIDK